MISGGGREDLRSSREGSHQPGEVGVTLPDVAVVLSDDVPLVQLFPSDHGALGLTLVLLDARVQRGVVVHLAGRTGFRLAPCAHRRKQTGPSSGRGYFYAAIVP